MPKLQKLVRALCLIMSILVALCFLAAWQKALGQTVPQRTPSPPMSMCEIMDRPSKSPIPTWSPILAKMFLMKVSSQLNDLGRVSEMQLSLRSLSRDVEILRGEVAAIARNTEIMLDFITEEYQ